MFMGLPAADATHPASAVQAAYGERLVLLIAQQVGASQQRLPDLLEVLRAITALAEP
jgi:hypothetical protein